MNSNNLARDDAEPSEVHDRVYVPAEGAVPDDSILDFARIVAESFSEKDVFVTSGPYRGYGVQYGVRDEEDIIWLDFYSVRPKLDVVEDVIDDLNSYFESEDESDE